MCRCADCVYRAGLLLQALLLPLVHQVIESPHIYTHTSQSSPEHKERGRRGCHCKLLEQEKKSISLRRGIQGEEIVKEALIGELVRSLEPVWWWKKLISAWLWGRLPPSPIHYHPHPENKTTHPVKYPRLQTLRWLKAELRKSESKCSGGRTRLLDADCLWREADSDARSSLILSTLFTHALSVSLRARVWAWVTLVTHGTRGSLGKRWQSMSNGGG